MGAVTLPAGNSPGEPPDATGPAPRTRGRLTAQNPTSRDGAPSE